MALPQPIIHTLFERGAFQPTDTTATAHALMAFAAGLPAFVMIKVFSPAYFAREDTKTPMWFAMTSVAINIAGALALFPFISYVGVALATSAAGWINALLLAITLSNRGDFALDARMRKALPRIIAASLIMGGVLLGLMQVCAPVFDASVNLLLRLLMLGVLVATGACVYFAIAWWSGALDLAALKASFSRKQAPRHDGLGRRGALRHIARHQQPEVHTEPVRMSTFTQRVFSGVQPTGNLHLGNYLGAIKRFVEMQASHECIYCVVDLHAITQDRSVWGGPAELARSTREVTAAYLAAGIDASQHIVFNQSQVTAHGELAWIFNCVARVGWLNRMTQFKEKAGKNRENASVGLYAYPNLMAADILAYKATHVPVG
jgi:hypothetical protein